jgi:hypothetical protein
MNRRAFLSSLGLAPLVARSYFDMGPSWQRHDSGLLMPTDRYFLTAQNAPPVLWDGRYTISYQQGGTDWADGGEIITRSFILTPAQISALHHTPVEILPPQRGPIRVLSVR